MARWAGKTGLIELEGPGVAAVVVSYLSAWTIDATKDKIDVTAMSDSNKVRLMGLPDYSGTFDFVWDDTQFIIEAAAEYLNAAYTLAIYPNGQISATHFWTGPAWIDYNVGGGVAEAVKGKVDWVAGGSWSRN